MTGRYTDQSLEVG